MLDKNGVEIKIGDMVTVEYKVTQLHQAKGGVSAKPLPARVKLLCGDHVEVIAASLVSVNQRDDKGNDSDKPEEPKNDQPSSH